MRYIVSFTDQHATRVDAVGGKGANLGVLTAAGLRVPPGFTVCTDAYRSFIERNAIGAMIRDTLSTIGYDDVEVLERETAKIRAAIEQAPVPEDVAAEIVQAYAALGGMPYVAVRSSGTAEDMTGASFAGLHDTYLDVQGEAAVLDAVRRCWASMWSARATSYRHSQGFDHAGVSIAVVIQVMVASEVSGVMFTANPLEARTDEIVVNASFGLGEAIVAGIVTPDAFTLDLATLRVKKRVLGSKEWRIDRAASPAAGTVSTPVDEADRGRYSLDDDAVVTLGALGRRIMDFYQGLPQDIEWAFAGGEFYVLQARPVTGVDFLWEDCLEAAVQDAPEDDQTIWTQKWAEMYWTGGITPLFYSIRGRHFRKGIQFMLDLAGFDELERVRYFEFRRGTIYYNADFHRTFIRWALPRFARAAMLDILPDAWMAEAAAAPLELSKYLRMLVGVNASRDAGFRHWQRTLRDWIDHRVAEADGLGDDELRGLSDEALKRYAFQQEEMQRLFSDALWVGFNIAAPHVLGLFGRMVSEWYKGDNKLILQDLISGNPVQSLQSREMHELFHLAMAIRESDTLSALFRDNEGRAFFDQLRGSDEGRRFLQRYEAFVAAHGHRGHADRDVYYLRRAEDPRLDYEALRSLINNPEPTPPWEVEKRVATKRERATAETMEHIGRQSFAALKARVFRLTQRKILDFLLLREDWRHYGDRITFSKRKAFLEVGRRAVLRGRLATVDDCFFLSDRELYDALDGRAAAPLTAAKIAARRRAFDRIDSRQESLPVYLRGRTPVALDGEQKGRAGAISGIGMSGGTATGRARVVPDLRQIGRVEKGDILICNATDPGWASIFTLINGLVIETGGMLAHGACLSREHGIPAVQLRNAMRLIPDGATVQIRGETGELVILEE